MANRLRHKLTRLQRNPSELFVVKLQSVARLLDLPIVDAGVRRYLRKEGFNFGAPEIKARPPRVTGKETLHPVEAVGDIFLLGPFLTKYSQIASRPLWIGVGRCRYAHGVLRHSKIPPLLCYASKYTRKTLQVNVAFEA
jgi:hypothetical protein